MKCESGSDEKLTIKKYRENIRPYLRDMIDNLKIFVEWKIQLTIKMNFVSTTGSIEYRQMDSKSDKKEITSGFETDKIIEELFESFL